MLFETDRWTKYSINRVMLSNFKTFKGEHWFDFKDITLLTGANNSGKSSLIKGLKLFSEAFTRADFPTLDKSAIEDMGSWDDIVNYEAQAEKFFQSEHRVLGFGIAFNIKQSNDESAEEKEMILKYRFTYDKNVKSYTFSRLDAYLDSDNPLFSFFRAFYTKKNYDSVYEDNSGEILFEFNTLELKNIIKGNDSLVVFLKYIEYNFGEIWWGELFQEEEFFDNKWSYSFSFDLLINEFYRDYYFNLARFEDKDHLLFDHENNQEAISGYYHAKETNNYIGFLRFFNQMSSFIQKHLRLISKNNLEFIKAEEIFHQRVILQSNNTRFLNTTLNIQEDSNISIESVPDILKKLEKRKNENQAKEKNVQIKNISLFNLLYNDLGENYRTFVWKSLKLFGLNGFVFVKSIEDHSFVVSFFHESKFTNIADMGKGTAKLVNLILKIASVAFDESRSSPDECLTKFQCNKTVFIEEPEAFLHPNWQSRLADLFAFSIKNTDVNIVIETHSEYIIRKLQYLVAKKKIEKDKILIYYFNNPDKSKENQTPKKNIGIKNTGQLTEDFGPGFFDESVQLLLGLLEDEIMN